MRGYDRGQSRTFQQLRSVLYRIQPVGIDYQLIAAVFYQLRDDISGIISSFAAQGYDAFDAAVCGAALHSLAAESAREKLTEYSMLPSDIVAEIPGVFARIGKTRNYR